MMLSKYVRYHRQSEQVRIVATEAERFKIEPASPGPADPDAMIDLHDSNGPQIQEI